MIAIAVLLGSWCERPNSEPPHAPTPTCSSSALPKSAQVKKVYNIQIRKKKTIMHLPNVLLTLGHMISSFLTCIGA